MHWIQKPAQWWKLPVLCVFSWNVGMCVYRYVDCPVSQSSRDSYFLWFDSHHTGYISFIFFVFYYWLVPVIIFISWLYLACNFKQITSSWTLKKKFWTNVVFCVFFPCFIRVCFESVYMLYITYCIYSWHCLAIPYVCQVCRPFCQCYLIVSCVDVQDSSLSQMFCLTENALLFTPYHLNVKKPASLFVWGCIGPVLWWETVLWSACALNIACEHKLDVWTITAFE